MIPPNGRWWTGCHDRRAHALLLDTQDLAAHTDSLSLECPARVKLLGTEWLAGHWIARGQVPLTERDLEDLPEAGRRVLAEHVGKPVCGLASLLGLLPDMDGYRPSAAFVAQQAAALVVGALIARQTKVVTGLVRDVEYDALFGPHPDMTVGRRPRAACQCQTDGDLIEEVRALRGRSSPQQVGPHGTVLGRRPLLLGEFLGRVPAGDGRCQDKSEYTYPAVCAMNEKRVRIE